MEDTAEQDTAGQTGLRHQSAGHWLEYEQCLVLAVRQEDGQSLHCQFPMHKLSGLQDPE